MKLIKKIVLLSYVAVASTESAMLTPAFPKIQQDFMLSNGQLSWLMTTFLIGYLLCQLMFGSLANRFGRLNCLRIGFVINLIGIALGIGAGMIHSYDVLLVSRFITALGAAVGLSGTFTLIHELMPEAEAKAALSYVVLSFMFGIGLGVYVGGVLVQHVDWIAVLAAMFIYGIVVLLSTFCFQEPLQQRQAMDLRTIVRGYVESLKHPGLIHYSFVLGVVTAVSYLYSTAAPLISEQFLHLSAAQYGSWNLLMMVGMLAGSLHGRSLIARFKMKRTLSIALWGLLISVILVAVILWVNLHSNLLFFTLCMLFYYFGGLAFPCASFFATQGAADRSSASGMMSFINLGTAAISLVLLGYLPLPLTMSFALILLFGVGLSVVLNRRMQSGNA